MTIPGAIELSLAIIGGLTVASFLFVLALFIDDSRVQRQRQRNDACRRHPSAAPHDWDAALAALTANDTPEGN